MTDQYISAFCKQNLMKTQVFEHAHTHTPLLCLWILCIWKFPYNSLVLASVSLNFIPTPGKSVSWNRARDEFVEDIYVHVMSLKSLHHNILWKNTRLTHQQKQILFSAHLRICSSRQECQESMKWETQWSSIMAKLRLFTWLYSRSACCYLQSLFSSPNTKEVGVVKVSKLCGYLNVKNMDYWSEWLAKELFQDFWGAGYCSHQVF